MTGLGKVVLELLCESCPVWNIGNLSLRDRAKEILILSDPFVYLIILSLSSKV